MRKEISSNELKLQTLNKLDTFLSTLITNGNSSKSDKISYWIQDWIDYLNEEKNFDSAKLLRYKRGSIIKVHLGFNVGSEEGGLHYAIVLDADNHLKSPLITVVPLTSVKDSKDLNNLPKDQLLLGDEIHRLLHSKLNLLLRDLQQVNLMESNEFDINKFEQNLSYAKRIMNELDKMKKGSIALLGQVTTISKMRIYDPKNKFGVLKNLRVSSDTLDSIDLKLKEILFKK